MTKLTTVHVTDELEQKIKAEIERLDVVARAAWAENRDYPTQAAVSKIEALRWVLGHAYERQVIA